MPRKHLSALVALSGLLGGAAAQFVTGPLLAMASRNSSGTYTPTAGIPFVTGTTISSTTVNTLVNDIGTEITDSLSRSGKGPMTAPLELANGTVALPAVTFDSDPDTGAYRIGANNLGIAVNGAKVLDVSTTGLGVTGTTLSGDGTVSLPGIGFTGDTDTGIYRIGVNSLGVAANGVLQLTASASGTTIGSGGTAISKSLASTFTWDAPDIATGTCTETVVSLSGTLDGAPCLYGHTATLPAGVMATCRVTTADQAAVGVCNFSGSNKDTASMDWSVRVFNP